ncbi:uncharacterized protein LOC135805677 [Sycon ciliatum]|uniref:uncharacterized protein LOC135805677 n=1 Tax=Sycon ciliatum TaxID=27933 RepID=UPI0031F6F85B
MTMEIDQKLFVKLKNSLPPELFERSEARFLLNTLRACFLWFAAAYVAAKFIPTSLGWWALPLWIVYAVVNGTFGFGIWVLAHECGHGAFSKSNFLNDLLGYPLHTFLLVPYFSWQYSHSVHHARTNHLTEGESFVPTVFGTRGEQWKNKWRRVVGDDVFSLFHNFYFVLFGWPQYLLTGVSGGPGRGRTNHFVPGESNKLFPKNWWPKIWASTAGILFVVGSVLYLSEQYGYGRMAGLFWAPHLVTNAWLVVYTYLHHTDDGAPHYDETTWNFTKGALCTIERNYPDFINWLHFGIGNTHVVHHLFSQLPHYNAWKARQILEPMYKDLYRVDKRPVWQALHENAVRCVSVREDPDAKGEWKYTSEPSASQ